MAKMNPLASALKFVFAASAAAAYHLAANPAPQSAQFGLAVAEVAENKVRKIGQKYFS